MKLIEVFKEVKKTFCSLWQFKERGETLEIITSFNTTTSKYISVFLTMRKDVYVVTDGGWLQNGEYESEIDYEDRLFRIAFNYFLKHYQIKAVEEKKQTFYFKTTNDYLLIPNVVNDLSYFILNIINSSEIRFREAFDQDHRFIKKTNNYISDIANAQSIIQFNQPISPKLKSVRFNAVLSDRAELKIFKYVTGSTPRDFCNSLSKARVDFEIIGNSEFNSRISGKYVMVNNEAKGYDYSSILPYYENLQNHIDHPPIAWENKEQLKALLNARLN